MESPRLKKAALVIGPIVFAFVLLLQLWFGPLLKELTISLLFWMLIWWSSRVVPIAVTSLLPLVLFPMVGILGFKLTAANYAHPVIFLFFGGFVLGIGIEKWNLHKRIALGIISKSGSSPGRIILGVMLSTWFMSMWISNTATTLMMLPIGLSILALLDDKITSPSKAGFSSAMMLGIAYAANVGGISTLIGTPPNLVLAAMYSEKTGSELGFDTWLLFSLPLVLLLFFFIFFFLTRVRYPQGNAPIQGIRELIEGGKRKLGKASLGEKRMLIVFFATALAWVLRSQIVKIPGLSNLSDPIIAMVAAVTLFLVPSGIKKTSLLIWRDAGRIPWEILLLFGGGISLAKGMEEIGIMQSLGNSIQSFGNLGLVIVILVITVSSLFLTEVMSNVALVSVFIPISFGISESLGVNYAILAIPLTIAASCAFMFPISTPPNAIVFSSRKISLAEMTKTGVLLNIFSAILIALYCWKIIPLLFQ